MAASLTTIPTMLSLDVTADLVAQGLRAPWKQGANEGDGPTFTIGVLNASNTTPIVITVASGALGELGPRVGTTMHVVIDGVLGNTAANKKDAVDLRNEAWVAVILSATTFALYDVDNSTGELVASVGNGAYTSGGRVSKAFSDGEILLGQEFVTESSAAIKVVMVPLRTTYGPANMTSAWNAASIAEGEQDRQRTAPSIRTTWWWFGVRIWAFDWYASNPMHRHRRGFDTVQLIQDAIIRAGYERGTTSFDVAAGTFLEQGEGDISRLKMGHGFDFQVGFAVPVPRTAIELSTVTEIDETMRIQKGNGTPEEA